MLIKGIQIFVYYLNVFICDLCVTRMVCLRLKGILVSIISMLGNFIISLMLPTLHDLTLSLILTDSTLPSVYS